MKYKKKALKDFVCWHVECIGSISINDYFLNMHESWNWILVPVRRDKIQLMLSELFSMQECQKGKKKWKQTEKKTKGMRYVVKKCLSLLSDSVTCMYSCKFEKKKYLTVDIGGTCPFKTICLACNIKVVSGKTAVNWKKISDSGNCCDFVCRVTYIKSCLGQNSVSGMSW